MPIYNLCYTPTVVVPDPPYVCECNCGDTDLCSATSAGSPDLDDGAMSSYDYSLLQGHDTGVPDDVVSQSVTAGGNPGDCRFADISSAGGGNSVSHLRFIHTGLSFSDEITCLGFEWDSIRELGIGSITGVEPLIRQSGTYYWASGATLLTSWETRGHCNYCRDDFYKFKVYPNDSGPNSGQLDLNDQEEPDWSGAVTTEFGFNLWAGNLIATDWELKVDNFKVWINPDCS